MNNPLPLLQPNELTERRDEQISLQQCVLFLAACTSFRSCYSILVSPMPVKNYVATFRLTRVRDAETALTEWWADFDVTSGSEDAMVAQIGDGVFVGGFKALQEKLAA